MDAPTFQRILATFSDGPTSLDLSKGSLIVEVRDELIEAKITQRSGSIVVTESDVDYDATTWILQRIARLSLLAERILGTLSDPEPFIVPRGELFDQLDRTDNTDEPVDVPDLVTVCLEILGRRPAFTSSVLYLTSDAGEGKTTVINHLARKQAHLYKQKATDWLLLPIALGGRPFLRFDDIVVGSLMNRFRFPLFYYDAFIELVRLGVIVPAFDGFEEMFIQNASGDALSAVGALMSTLQSNGTVMIAARKAYFDYQDIRMQARLFDSIGNFSVSFARLGVKRWGKGEFVEYGIKRGFPDAELVYKSISERLNDLNHPLLTRAVLVRRLYDVAESVGELKDLLIRLGNSPHDYFYVFVETILQREATEKWIDSSGDAAKPLLTVEEHMELLSLLSQEMWLLGSEALKSEVIDFVTDLFCEEHQKPPTVATQIRERTKQHALIVSSGSRNSQFSFDHEEFRNFFLGEAVGRLLLQSKSSNTELLSVFRKGELTIQTQQSCISRIRRATLPDSKQVVDKLKACAASDGASSFTHENCTSILLRVISGQNHAPLELVGFAFGVDALRDISLTSVVFENCIFASTSLENCSLTDCRFEKCRFDMLTVFKTTKLKDAVMTGCSFVGFLKDGEAAVFAPNVVRRRLQWAGFTILEGGGLVAAAQDTPAPDAQFEMLERLIRYFLRSTQINENTLRMKLGPIAPECFQHTIPELLEAGVLVTVPWTGNDYQRRYKLNASMEKTSEALRAADGSKLEFIKAMQEPP